MNPKLNISAKQIKGLLVSAVVGVGILSMPGELANILGLDGWILILLGAIILLPIIFMIVKIFEYYPGMDLFQISRIVLGPIVDIIYKIIFLIYIIILLSYVSRVLGEVVKAFLLEVTPIEVIIFTFILSSSYIARSEIDVIGRMGYLIYPIILIFTGFLIVVSLPNINPSNLIPVFQLEITAIPKGLTKGFISFVGIELLLFVLPYSEDKDKALKSSLYALGIITTVYLIIFFLAASQFGIEELKRLPWATLSLVKEISLPGLFLENLDGIAMALWVMVAFGTLAPSYFLAGKLLANLTKAKSHEMFILPLIPIIYTVALIPQDPIKLTETMGNILNWMGIFIIIIMPIVLFVLAYFKKGRVVN